MRSLVAAVSAGKERSAGKSSKLSRRPCSFRSIPQSKWSLGSPFSMTRPLRVKWIRRRSDACPALVSSGDEKKPALWGRFQFQGSLRHFVKQYNTILAKSEAVRWPGKTNIVLALAIARLWLMRKHRNLCDIRLSPVFLSFSVADPSRLHQD